MICHWEIRDKKNQLQLSSVKILLNNINFKNDFENFHNFFAEMLAFYTVEILENIDHILCKQKNILKGNQNFKSLN